MKVSVFGTGYVGLVTGTCLSEVGHHVVCVDVDVDKIAGLRQGVLPIFEPGLDALVLGNVAAGRLQFTTEPVEALDQADIVFIAVGTPPDEDGSADLRHVLQVARTIGEHITHPTVVVNKSTVPVGTADKVRESIVGELARRNIELDFQVVSNPEFLKEGDAVADCMRPDRIIIGTDDPAAVDLLKRLYGPFNRNHDRIVTMDIRSAELTKYAANAMLATKISFMNEIANIAERVGADVEMVRLGIGSDPRIGWHFIYPGAGYGGSCFPKDVQALSKAASKCGHEAVLLNAVEDVNRRQKAHLFELVDRHYLGRIAGKTFAVWGLAFKPNTDDMREAPSRELLSLLWAAGAKVQAFDPVAGDEARRIFGARPDLRVCDTAEHALDGADGLIVVTEWKQFRSPDFGQVRAAIRDRVIFDGRNVYDPELVEQMGIAYYGIGRGRSIRGPVTAVRK